MTNYTEGPSFPHALYWDTIAQDLNKYKEDETKHVFIIRRGENDHPIVPYVTNSWLSALFYYLTSVFSPTVDRMYWLSGKDVQEIKNDLTIQQTKTQDIFDNSLRGEGLRRAEPVPPPVRDEYEDLSTDALPEEPEAKAEGDLSDGEEEDHTVEEVRRRELRKEREKVREKDIEDL